MIPLTPELLKKIEDSGAKIIEITLDDLQRAVPIEGPKPSE